MSTADLNRLLLVGFSDLMCCARSMCRQLEGDGFHKRHCPVMPLCGIVQAIVFQRECDFDFAT